MSEAPVMPAPEPDDFYVGYLPAPRGVARFVRRIVEGLAALTIAVALVAAAAQSPPGPGEFPTTIDAHVSGIPFRAPVPMFLHSREDGSRRWLLMVGEFKRGPDERAALAPHGWVAAKGRVIGVPGALAPGCLELPAGADAFRILHPVGAEGPDPTSAPERPLGRITLRGQIIDPKCHFGAMKPGEGKVHRGCAVRCISGGIPPVLMVRERAPGAGAPARTAYYLLLDAQGDAVNHRVLEFVAEPVEITGDASRLVAPDGSSVGDDSLRVLRFDPATIRRR